MYMPKANEETRVEVMHDLIRRHRLGTWVVQSGGQLHANHVPFLVDSGRADDPNQLGILRAHIARANPLWQMALVAPSIVIFQGPDHYITPSWYPSKHEHGKAVPTWAYAVVHAHGVPRFIEDRAWLLENVSELTNAQEGGRAVPWQVSDAPPEYIEQLLGAIVGVEMVITRLEGKWKTNQNRPLADKLGMVAGLTGVQTDKARAMAELVQAHALAAK